MRVKDLQDICKKYKLDHHFREQIDALDPSTHIVDFSAEDTATIWTQNELERVKNIILDTEEQIRCYRELMKQNHLMTKKNRETQEVNYGI